jgi:uncharacterized protein
VKFPLLLGLLLAIAASGCKQGKNSAPPAPAPAPPTNAAAALPSLFFLPHAQTNLQRMKLYIGAQELDTAVALKPLERQTGMMWRTNMAENEAMLFPFPFPHRASFYMKNTYLALSAAYIDPEGVIQEIHDFHPLNETPVVANSDNIQHVLEVPQGWFKRHGITTGALVRTQYGDLKNTFSFQRQQ